MLRNLDTDEVLASFKQERTGVGRDGEKVGEVKWWSDVTVDEEVGSMMVLVGMWFRMSQLEIGGDYEKVVKAEEERVLERQVQVQQQQQQQQQQRVVGGERGSISGWERVGQAGMVGGR